MGSTFDWLRSIISAAQDIEKLREIAMAVVASYENTADGINALPDWTGIEEIEKKY